MNKVGKLSCSMSCILPCWWPVSQDCEFKPVIKWHFNYRSTHTVIKHHLKVLDNPRFHDLTFELTCWIFNNIRRNLWVSGRSKTDISRLFLVGHNLCSWPVSVWNEQFVNNCEVEWLLCGFWSQPLGGWLDFWITLIWFQKHNHSIWSQKVTPQSLK